MSFSVWFTGLSGAGKTTLSSRLYAVLMQNGVRCELLDGDVIRRNFSQELNFSREHRHIQGKRVGFVCHLLNKHAITCVAALITPYAATRRANRILIPNYVEVYVRCPLDVLKKRDPAGYYKRAMAGEIKNFTGISDPFEEPVDSEIVVDTAEQSVEESLGLIVARLKDLGYLPSEMIGGDV
ncbi:MAG: adenylyl-sulfate kinase [Desulfovibrionaceae bacterium]|jgi:adenylylsulfate kinase